MFNRTVLKELQLHKIIIKKPLLKFTMVDTSNTIGVGGFQYTDEQVTGDINEYNPFEVPVLYKRDYKPTELIVYPTSDSAGKFGQPYEFKVEQNPYLWTNLQKIRIGGQIRIQNKTTNEPIVTDEAKSEFEDFGPINNYKQAIWSKIICKIQGCEISDPSADPYPWKSYLETLLNYTSEYKHTVLKSGSGWVEEEANDGDKLSCLEKKGNVSNKDYNSALKARRVGIMTGRWEEFDVLMHSDVITAEKPLPPGYTIEFKMTRMSNEFLLIQPKTNQNKYEVELQDVHLVIERIQKPDSQLQAYNLRKNSSMARIALTRNFIKTYPVQKGQTDLCVYNLIVSDKLPETVIVWIVPQTAYNGSTDTNPFNFKTLAVQNCCLLVNNELEPTQPHSNLVEDLRRNRLYNNFLDNIGSSQRDSICCSITPDKYYNGYHMFGKLFSKVCKQSLMTFSFSAFDRTKTNRKKRYQMDNGTLGVLLRLKKELTENMQVIVYCTYSSEIILKGSEVITHTF